MRFTSPLALFGLLILLPILMLGWPARGFTRRREMISLAIRLVICVALVLGLAGFEFKDIGKSNTLAVVFLLDVSDSMPPAAVQAGMEFIRQALQHKRPDDQAAVVVFGRDALVEKAMSTDASLPDLTSIPLTEQSNLDRAVNLGLALFTPGMGRRMVILSDGAFTSGKPSNALQVAAASGVEIVALPFVVETTSEILVEEITLPPHLRQGDQFDLNLKINSNLAQTASVRVYSGGSLVYEGDLEITTGEQSFSLPLSAEEPGFTSYQVSITGQSDHYYQNNQLSTFSQIEGAPRVLIVAPQAGESMNFKGEIRPDETGPLQEILEANGFLVDRLIPEMMPLGLADLASYASVILVDVPAKRLTGAQMTALQSFVRDLGGGLVAVGGPTSYGVGGYFRTPLEEILPVDMQIKDEKRRPTLAMVFIVDHSGSMSEASGGPSKLDLAKEAVIRSVDLLNPLDQVGVIAFDDAASWVVKLAELDDGSEVKTRVASIGIGGGTDILAGVQAMAAVMPSVDAGARHVVLLTDGGADPTGIPELVEKLYTEDGITLSTIGVGRDAAPFLADLAVLGGGRYHFAENPASIPNIYTEETSLATRSYLIEEAFVPEIAAPSPLLVGIEAFPALLGYVGTSPKETAQTILLSHMGDPILAQWRYGLGKSIAFTSDSSGRWAKEWLAWPQFSTFWSQIVRSSFNNEMPASLDIETEYQNGVAHITVDGGSQNQTVQTQGDRYLNNYAMEAAIINPNGETTLTEFLQIAPGKYEAEFTPVEEGVYLIRVSGTSPDPAAPVVGETAGWILDYSPEYRQLVGDPERLLRLVLQSGGRLAEQDPAETFSHTLPSPGIYYPVWPWLLFAAAVLLPVDIAIRRLTITRSELLRLQAAVSQLVRRRRLRSETIPPSERMRGLLEMKERAGQRYTPPGRTGIRAGAASIEDHSSPGTAKQPIDRQPTIPESTNVKTPARVEPSQPGSTGQEELAPPSSVGKLLAKKRAQRKRD